MSSASTFKTDQIKFNYFAEGCMPTIPFLRLVIVSCLVVYLFPFLIYNLRYPRQTTLRVHTILSLILLIPLEVDAVCYLQR